MSNFTTLGISEMREALLKKEVSALQLVEEHLNRTKETASINSFITVTENEARESAELADKVLSKKGESSPYLTGIPVGIKDQLVTKGIETTCASKMLKGFIPPYDCTAVSKLKNAGAIVLGKTNQDEFAMGSSNEFSAYGAVSNPWNLSCVPGGSSGGSAASVAAGQVPLSLGTDTGGSIRQPASLCGVVGLKPTYGRVSRYGAVAFASSLDQIGPFARSVEDVAICMNVISGFDENDASSMQVPVPDYQATLSEWKNKDLSGVRIGIPKDFLGKDNLGQGIDEEVLSQFNSSIELVKNLGAKVVDISLPHSEYALAAYYITASAEASSNLARFDGIRYGYRSSNFESLDDLYKKSRAEGFGNEVKRRILIGSFVLSSGYYDAYYKKAQQIRTLILNDYKAAFTNSCDFILTPVSPTVAFEKGKKTSSPLTMYLADIFTVPVNLAGLPAISLPFACNSKGMPIGIQLIGAFFTEDSLLGVSSVIERSAKFPVSSKAKGSLS